MRRVLLSVCVPLAVLLATLLYTVQALPAQAGPLLLLTVDSSDDSNICAPPTLVCTLRGAINVANANPGSTINFDSSVGVITLTKSLPVITGAGTTIDGTGAVPTINGSGMSSGDMFIVNADDVTIRALQLINGVQDIFAESADIRLIGGIRARIFFNRIGVRSSSSDCSSGALYRASRYGVVLSNTVSGSALAGNAGAYIYGNVVGCHQLHGIVLLGADYVYIGQDQSGLSSPNYVGVNEFGSALPNGAYGLLITQYGSDGAEHNIVRDNFIAGNGEHGIYVGGINTDLNTIGGNLIGLRADGSALANGGDGIHFAGGTRNNVVGSDGLVFPGASGRNWIGGNAGHGIAFVSAGDANFVGGNYIGTSLAGNAARANLGDGVFITDTTSTLITGNVIAANVSGISVQNATHNTIAANLIGTNAAGNAPLGNTFGVLLDFGAQYNVVGGTRTADRNLISGNTAHGVLVEGSGDDTSFNTVAGNWIGTNVSGTAAISNGLDGILLFYANNNYVSAPSGGVAQYISGNGAVGVQIVGSNQTAVTAYNVIGLSPSGSELGNGSHGVSIEGGSDNVIVPTTIYYNGGAGVAVSGASALRNRITPTFVRYNRGLPIDLNNDGPTPNDPGDLDTGPNTLLNYPVVTASAGSTVSGTACASCTVYIYRATGNPAAGGGGGAYLMQVTAGAGGAWSAALSGGLTPAEITLLAVDPSGNTSEMRPRPQLLLPLIRR